MINQVGFIKVNDNLINTAAITAVEGKYNPKIITNNKVYCTNGRYTGEEIAKDVIDAQTNGKIIDVTI